MNLDNNYNFYFKNKLKDIKYIENITYDQTFIQYVDGIVEKH